MAGTRVHAILLTRCPRTVVHESGPQIRPGTLENSFPHIPSFYTRHQPFLFKYYQENIGAKTILPDSLGDLKNRKVVLFSGIAQNHSFLDTVVQARIQVLDHLEFMDHYRYNRADFFRIRQRAEDLGAGLILTTEKDWTKVDPSFAWSIDLAVVGIQIEFQKPDEFKEMIGDLFQGDIPRIV